MAERTELDYGALGMTRKRGLDFGSLRRSRSRWSGYGVLRVVGRETGYRSLGVTRERSGCRALGRGFGYRTLGVARGRGVGYRILRLAGAILLKRFFGFLCVYSSLKCAK